MISRRDAIKGATAMVASAAVPAVIGPQLLEGRGVSVIRQVLHEFHYILPAAPSPWQFVNLFPAADGCWVATDNFVIEPYPVASR